MCTLSCSEKISLWCILVSFNQVNCHQTHIIVTICIRWRKWQSDHFKWWRTCGCVDLCETQGWRTIPPLHSAIGRSKSCTVDICFKWEHSRRSPLYGHLRWLWGTSAWIPLQVSAMPWLWPLWQMWNEWPSSRSPNDSSFRRLGNSKFVYTWNHWWLIHWLLYLVEWLTEWLMAQFQQQHHHG